METINKIKIERENLSTIGFSSQDVLNNKEEKAIRWHELQRAMALGNLHKVPSKILFRGEVGQVYETEETIWAVTERYVIFKNSIMLPIHAIEKVIV